MKRKFQPPTVVGYKPPRVTDASKLPELAPSNDPTAALAKVPAEESKTTKKQTTSKRVKIPPKAAKVLPSDQTVSLAKNPKGKQPPKKATAAPKTRTTARTKKQASSVAAAADDDDIKQKAAKALKQVTHKNQAKRTVRFNLPESPSVPDANFKAGDTTQHTTPTINLLPPVVLADDACKSLPSPFTIINGLPVPVQKTAIECVAQLTCLSGFKEAVEAINDALAPSIYEVQTSQHKSLLTLFCGTARGGSLDQSRVQAKLLSLLDKEEDTVTQPVLAPPQKCQPPPATAAIPVELEMSTTPGLSHNTTTTPNVGGGPIKKQMPQYWVPIEDVKFNEAALGASLVAEVLMPMSLVRQLALF